VRRNAASASSRGPREVEAALIVRSEKPKEVVGRIARLRRIGRYRLVPRPVQEIRDRYFDTPRNDLGTRRLALRIREMDGERLLTLKGDLRRDGVSTRRLELEAPWARESLRRVLGELRELDVLPKARGTPPVTAADPAKALGRLDLTEIQERKTRRMVRHIVDPDDEARVLAELVIDSVTYRFGRRAARIHEVEVEAKTGEVDLDEIVGALRERVPGLEEWAYGKLPTGKAIELGLTEGTLAVGEDGVVEPSAYDLLAGYLARGEV